MFVVGIASTVPAAWTSRAGYAAEMKAPWLVCGIVVLGVVACPGSEGGQDGTTSAGATTMSGVNGTTGPGDATSVANSTGMVPTSGGADGTTTTDPGATAGDTTTGSPACAWGDGSCTPGALLFCEGFDDADLAGRGWYDGPAGTIDPDAYSGAGAFACQFDPGATGCSGGHPARHPVAPTASVWLSFWIRHSADWIGSGKPYHPHQFHFVTNVDDDFVGPAGTHLTTYVEAVGDTPRLAIQDLLNVDSNCVLRNDDSFVGCNGDYATYAFTEMRSAAACNGLLGALDGRDCFDAGGGQWYSARYWDSPVAVFAEAAPYDQRDWHRVEVYFQLNTIADGVGVVDGQLKYWFDGVLLIDLDDVFYRTGAHPGMMFDQFLMLPYIGDGSPIGQAFWVDDLRVATAPTDAPCP